MLNRYTAGMSDDTIRPALSAGEWSDALRDGAYDVDDSLHVMDFTGGARSELDLRMPGGETEIRDKPRHALAALALYDQPFGFTREMVRALNEMLSLAEYGCEESPLMELAEEAVKRIEALLPPHAASD